MESSSSVWSVPGTLYSHHHGRHHHRRDGARRRRPPNADFRLIRFQSYLSTKFTSTWNHLACRPPRATQLVAIRHVARSRNSTGLASRNQHAEQNRQQQQQLLLLHEQVRLDHGGLGFWKIVFWLV